MRLYLTSCIVVGLIASAAPARAQVVADKYIPISSLAAESAAVEAIEKAQILPTQVLRPSAVARTEGSPTLPLLYVSMAALQTLDIVSTHKALGQPGAYEANAMFGSVGQSLPAQIALKAGATAGMVLLTRHLAKTNRVAAITTMAVLNSAYAMVVAHNFVVASGVR